MPKKVASKLPWELVELSNHVGDFMQYWGFKSIHGRIWTLLFLSKTPLDATRLVSLLKVSKTLVSFAVKELIDYDVIREVGQGPRGTVLLAANPDISTVIVNVLQTREKVMLSKSLASAKMISQMSAEGQSQFASDADKVKELIQFIQSAQAGLEMICKTGALGGDFFATLASLENE